MTAPQRNSPIALKVISHKSPEYDQAIALRSKLLREPLGLRFTQDQIEAESAYIHLVAIKELGDVIATVVLVPAKEIAFVRQVAVSQEMQSLGIGRMIMEFAEDEARKRGCKEVHLHARRVVEGFYKRLGYHTYGEEFNQVNIPHIAMSKQVAQQN